MANLHARHQHIARRVSRRKCATGKYHVDFGLVRDVITRSEKRRLGIVIPRNVPMHRILLRRDHRIRSVRQDERALHTDREAMPSGMFAPYDRSHAKWAESNDFQRR